ncbi:MAG: hypothetical protein AAF802_06320, partial [Planctomycetota bacterium]
IAGTFLCRHLSLPAPFIAGTFHCRHLSLPAPFIAGTFHCRFIAGTVHSGTVHSGTVHSGTVHSGTVHSGTVHSGTVHSGTVHCWHRSFAGTVHSLAPFIRQITAKAERVRRRICRAIDWRIGAARRFSRSESLASAKLLDQQRSVLWEVCWLTRRSLSVMRSMTFYEAAAVKPLSRFLKYELG